MSLDVPILPLKKDSTIRWSCRPGDFILWFRAKGIFADPEHAGTVLDIWEMRDGDFVTITNRAEDLPEGFVLHPSEVCNRLAHEMVKRLNNGYQPGEIMEGSNLWRPKGGDRLVWVGPSRPGTESTGGVLSVLDFRECALAVGESNRIGIQDLFAFGSLSESHRSPEAIRMCQTAVEIVRKMGMPRTFALEWRLG